MLVAYRIAGGKYKVVSFSEVNEEECKPFAEDYKKLLSGVLDYAMYESMEELPAHVKKAMGWS